MANLSVNQDRANRWIRGEKSLLCLLNESVCRGGAKKNRKDKICSACMKFYGVEALEFVRQALIRTSQQINKQSPEVMLSLIKEASEKLRAQDGIVLEELALQIAKERRLPFGPVLQAVEMANEKISNIAKIVSTPEAEERRKEFKELQHEVFVTIDVKTPSYHFAYLEDWSNLNEMNGLPVPKAMIEIACRKVNEKRAKAKEKWEKEVDGYVKEKIREMYTDYINVEEVVFYGMTFRGRKIHGDRLRQACWQVIKERKQQKRADWIESNRREAQPKVSQPQISKKVFTINRYAFLHQDRNHSAAAAAQ